MLKTIRGLILGLVVLVDSAYVTPTYASSASIVIIRVQAGSLTSPLHEAVTIYNNSDERVDLSQWCFVNKAKVRFACFGQVGIRGDRFLPPRAATTVISEQLAQTTPYEHYSVAYAVTHSGSGSIIASSDVISLVDSSGMVIDQHLWASPLVSGAVWQRKFTSSDVLSYIDTDTVSDWKTAMADALPKSDTDFTAYGTENDSCTNLAGHQYSVPRGYSYEEPFLCHPMPAIDPDITEGYFDITEAPVEEPGEPVGDDDSDEQEENGGLDDDAEQAVQSLHPGLSEILANAEGSDEDREYIELHNPHNEEIDVSLYAIHYGKNLEKKISLPFTTLSAGEYRAITNTQGSFSLLNTESRVALFKGDLMIDETSYSNPKEDWSWARDGDSWRYTKIATPNTPNQFSVQTEDAQVTKPSAAPVPKPCNPGQERNPETGRCRAVVATTAESAPCKEGQERNPETNRCRTIKQMPEASYAVIGARSEAQPASQWYLWVSIAGVGVLALSYALWEWRVEIGRSLKKISRVFASTRK